MNRPEAAPEDLGLAELAAQLEAVEQLEDADQRGRLLSILHAYEAVHRRALGRLLALVGEADPDLAARLYADSAVRVLHDLYDLPPPGPHAAAAAAIEEVRPYARSHGGDVELVAVRDGVVRVRLSGSCVGCRGSTATLRQWVDARLADRVPGYRGLEVVEAGHPEEPPRRLATGPHGPPPGPAVIPLTEIQEGEPYVEEGVARLADVHEDRLHGFRIGELPVLVVRRGEQVRAFIDGCGGSPLLLSVGGTLRDGEIRCPWHGCRYAADTGEAIAARRAPLPRLPVRVEAGTVVVAVPASLARGRGGAA